MHYHLRQTEICITVRRHSWHLLQLCAVHTTHNSSHLADCVASLYECNAGHDLEQVSPEDVKNLIACCKSKFLLSDLVNWR